MTEHDDRAARARDALAHATRTAGGSPARGADGAARGSADAEPTSGRRRRPRGRAPEPPTVGSAAVDAEPDAEGVARTIALRLLTGAPRSRAQLAEAMARKEVPEAVADRVLDRFEEVGLVDDAAYAAMLVRTRQSERGLARRALAVELRRKGLDPETAAGALQTVDGDDEEDAARRLVAKRLRSMRDLDTEVKRRRLVAMLARKGHGGGVAWRVVDEALRLSGA